MINKITIFYTVNYLLKEKNPYRKIHHMYCFTIRKKGQEMMLSGLKPTGMGWEIIWWVSPFGCRVYLPEMVVGGDRRIGFSEAVTALFLSSN